MSPTPVPAEEIGVACIMEAKVCPDGSSVGRSGPNCEFTPCPVSSISVQKMYEGRLNPFTLNYPSTYEIELADVEDANNAIEQVIFRNAMSTVDEFSIRVDKKVTKLPEFPYDQEPTGEYTLDGVAGKYLELPQGYADGANGNPRSVQKVFMKEMGE